MTRRCQRVDGVKTEALPAGRRTRQKEDQSRNCPLLPVSFWYQYSGLQKRQKELKTQIAETDDFKGDRQNKK